MARPAHYHHLLSALEELYKARDTIEVRVKLYSDVADVMEKILEMFVENFPNETVKAMRIAALEE